MPSRIARRRGGPSSLRVTAWWNSIWLSRTTTNIAMETGRFWGRLKKQITFIGHNAFACSRSCISAHLLNHLNHCTKTLSYFIPVEYNPDVRFNHFLSVFQRWFVQNISAYWVVVEKVPTETAVTCVTGVQSYWSISTYISVAYGLLIPTQYQHYP